MPVSGARFSIYRDFSQVPAQSIFLHQHTYRLRFDNKMGVYPVSLQHLQVHVILARPYLFGDFPHEHPGVGVGVQASFLTFSASFAVYIRSFIPDTNRLARVGNVTRSDSHRPASSTDHLALSKSSSIRHLLRSRECAALKADGQISNSRQILLDESI